jgi:hypothetical protein
MQRKVLKEASNSKYSSKVNVSVDALHSSDLMMKLNLIKNVVILLLPSNIT